MATILGVGIAVLDVITLVDHFPIENQKSRALARTVRRGGNTTNTLVVLSQLSHRCSWAGNHVGGPEAEIINFDLNKNDIDFSLCQIVENSHVPTSSIILNKSNGTRTIIHFRDLPEYTFFDFKQINLSPFEWIHFEGRNAKETLLMMQMAHSMPNLKCSLEIEKVSPDIEKCIQYADVVFVSREYVTQSGYTTAEAFLEYRTKQSSGPIFICAWGESGAYAKVNGEKTEYSAAVKLDKIIDTIGAGDAFNAGFIHAQIENRNIQASLQIACQIAAKKCTQMGFDNIIRHN